MLLSSLPPPPFLQVLKLAQELSAAMGDLSDTVDGLVGISPLARELSGVGEGSKEATKSALSNEVLEAKTMEDAL